MELDLFLHSSPLERTMTARSSKRKKIDLTVLVLAVVIMGVTVSLFFMASKTSIHYDPKYIEVANQVGPQFDRISRYLDNLGKYYNSPADIPKSEARKSSERKAGNFRIQMKSMGTYNGKLGYCLVAQHISNKGRAYYSSVPIKDPSWEGKRSYQHYVTGEEPVPDLDGPCNERVINGSR